MLCRILPTNSQYFLCSIGDNKLWISISGFESLRGSQSFQSLPRKLTILGPTAVKNVLTARRRRLPRRTAIRPPGPIVVIQIDGAHLNMVKRRAMRAQSLGWRTIAREMRVSGERPCAVRLKCQEREQPDLRSAHDTGARRAGILSVMRFSQASSKRDQSTP